MESAASPPPSVSAERMQQLTRLSRAFTYARALDEILRLAVDQAAELVGAESAVLMLTDEAGLLRVRAAHGVDLSVIERFENPVDESLVSRLRGLLGGALANSFLGVPLVSRGKVVGLLATVRPDGHRPTEDAEWLLSALADQLAAPLENARLARQLESSALLADNVRLYESERDARLLAEAALDRAETAQREAEAARDAAIQADLSKTSFLAAMSHELRTPLNAIGGYADLLAMGLRGPVTREQTEDLNRIKASQGHLLQLITEVLEYARVGAGQLELRIGNVDVQAVLRDAEVMILPQMLAKPLTYSYQPCAGEVIVRADAHRLLQIVLNLLTNAIKFTPAGGTIRMSCVVESDAAGVGVARVSVTDTGSGIPANRLETIWQPFVQLGRKLNQPGEGVGLGLAISRDLADAMGGRLSVTSEVGVGSVFTLALPVTRGAPTGSKPA